MVSSSATAMAYVSMLVTVRYFDAEARETFAFVACGRGAAESWEAELFENNRLQAGKSALVQALGEAMATVSNAIADSISTRSELQR